MDTNLLENHAYTHHANVNQIADIPGLFRRFGSCMQRGNYELYCMEFAFVMIHGSLKASNLPAILSLLELNQLPNIMFLIQMDDFLRVYSPYPEFSIYNNKSNVVSAIGKILNKRRIEHIVTRFLGYGTICVFLRLEGRTVTDFETRTHVETLAGDIVKFVYDNTQESISVGVSDFCPTHTQFPQAYTQCKQSLMRTFFFGRRSVVIYEKPKKRQDAPRGNPTRAAITNLINAINRDELEACETIVNDMADWHRRVELSPVTMRLHFAGLFARIVDYYSGAGIEQDLLTNIGIDSLQKVISCSFLCDVASVIINFCGKIAGLYKTSRQSVEERFLRHTNDCIERHCGDSLFGLSTIATLSNYSPSYFSRLFTKVYGIPFSRYLAHFRIEKAKRFLSQNVMTLREVAAKSGFCSTSYFCSVFKKITGMPPRQYSVLRDHKTHTPMGSPL